MVKIKTGRPRLPGERTASGRRKPADPRGEATWRRLQDNAVLMALDPRAISELFRLKLLGVLTDAQVEAGHRMAEVYATYERFHQLRRSCKSPVYLASFGGEGVCDERMEGAQLKRRDKQMRRADRAFNSLQQEIPAFPVEARGTLERLCVENTRIPDCYYSDLAVMLQRLAMYFGLAPQPKNSTGFRSAPEHRWGNGNKPLLRKTAPATVAVEQKRPRRADPNKKPFSQVLKALRPDLTPDEIEQSYDVLNALKERNSIRLRTHKEPRR